MFGRTKARTGVGAAKSGSGGIAAEAPRGLKPWPAFTAFRESAVRDVVSGRLPAAAFQRAGSTTPPPEGARVADWVAEAIDRAATLPITASRYALDAPLMEALSEHYADHVDVVAAASDPDGFPTAFERAASSAAARFAWYGDDLRIEERITIETEILRDQDADAIRARFARTPHVRLDPVPVADAGLRCWIEDMLRGEAYAISAGMVTPTDVARIACLSRLPIIHPAIPAGATRIVTTFPGYHPEVYAQMMRDERSARLAELSRFTMLRRFSAQPGFADAAQAEETAESQEGWRLLLAKALVAERVREVTGMSADVGPYEEVALDDVELRPDGDGMGFSGDLIAFGDRVCRLTGDGAGVMTADAWSEGSGPGDLDALDAYVAATGEPRDDGRMPDSLALRIMDAVIERTIVEAYLQESADAVLFAVEDATGGSIDRAPLGPEGDRLAAAAVYSAKAPRAVSLDELPDAVAARLWFDLA